MSSEKASKAEAREKNLIRLERDLAVRLNSATTLKEALEEILSAAIKIEGVDGGGIYILDNSGRLNLIVNSGLSSSFVEKVRVYSSRSANSRLVKKGKSFYMKGSESVPSMENIFRNEGIKSIAVIPIVNKGNVLGSFNLASKKCSVFPKYARETAESIALDMSSVIVRINAERKDIELSELKSRFVRDASHELRTPLTTITMNVDLLKRYCEKKEAHEKAKETLKMLDRNVKRLNWTVENILNFERIKKGRESYVFSKESLSDLIKEEVELFRMLAEAENVKIIKKVPKVISVRMDKAKISVVLRNLLDNALKFDSKGPIIVTAEDLGKEVKVTVSDNGRGLTSEEIKNVFSDFFKGNPNEKGEGIGLAICEAIIEKHGGTIWAESGGINKGSCFFFCLPKK